jgi:hypothetical protein
MTSVPGTPLDPAAAAHPPRRMRASDAERAVVVRRLQDALSRGLLTFDEAGERIAAAHAARFLDELPRLSSDLPAPPPAEPAAVGWRRLGESLMTQLRHELHTTTSAGVRSRRFVLTVAALLLLGAMFVAMVAAAAHGIDGPPHFHGPGDFDGDGH